jgi:transcription termination factor Rho
LIPADEGKPTVSETTDYLTDSGQAAESGPSAAPAGEARPRRRAAGLSGMLLPELQGLATTLGITGTGRMRKGELVAAIQAKQGGNGAGQSAAGNAPAQDQLPLGGAPAGPDATVAAAPARTRQRRTASRPAGSPDAAGGTGTAPGETSAVPVGAGETSSNPAGDPILDAAATTVTGRRPADRPAGDRGATDGAATDGAASDRASTGRSAGDRPGTDRAVGDRTTTDRATTERPGSDRGATDRSDSDRGATERPATDRPADDRSTGERQNGDRQTGERQNGDRAERPAGDRQAGERPARRERAPRDGDTRGNRPERSEGADRADERGEGGTDRPRRDRSDQRGDRNTDRNTDRGADRGTDRGAGSDEADGQQGGDNRADRPRRDRTDQRAAQGGGTDSRGTDSRGTDSRAGSDNRSDNRSGENRGSRNTDRTDRADRTDRDDDDDFDGRGGSRRRGRFRDRNRRGRTGGTGDRFAGDQAEPTIAEDDVLLPVAGILDILDNYAFVRTSGYLTGPNDVYVSLAQVRRYGLRRGDAVTGAVKQPREGERRDKYNALVRLDTINGMDPEQARNRPEFMKLTPLYPQDRLRLETEPHLLTPRVIDLVMPIGKGQRALIVSPPKAGKTMIMQAIANAVTTNNPECHLMVVLVDERPEEVTDMQRAVKGEVIASTFDRPPTDHTTVAELSIERAKRLVELGHDVVVLLDNITRLGRAYNLAAPASGRILSGGVDSTALYPPKRFLGAARNIENGGSLTILATALIETGSTMDTVIFEEFKGTGNAELILSRKIANKRVFPAVDVIQSSTRKEEILLAPDELAIVHKLRRVLNALDPESAIELLLDRLKQSRTNIEFLMQIAKSAPGQD